MYFVGSAPSWKAEVKAVMDYEEFDAWFDRQKELFPIQFVPKG
jgi:hypothetical protein